MNINESLSFIYFISDEKFKNFFIITCNMNESEFQKIYDISKDINEHKHDTEKEICIENVIDYMKIVFNFTYIYYKNIISNKFIFFEPLYFYNIFGQTEKEIEDLKKQRLKLEKSLLDENEQKSLLISDLETVNNLTTEKDLKLHSIEKQKDILEKEVSKLKDIKLTTMEEKVARIVDILDRQTTLMEKMESYLRDGQNNKWGKPETPPGV